MAVMSFVNITGSFNNSYPSLVTTNDLQMTTLSNHILQTSLVSATDLTGVNLPENLPENSLITQEFYERFQFICYFIINPIICVIGLISNSLGIGVLWQDKKEQRLSIYLYICALTLWDLCFLALGILRMIPEIIRHFDVKLSKYIDAQIKPGLTYVDMILTFNSAGMILVMSFERLLSLVKPLTMKDTWFGRYPMRIILFVVLFNVLLLVPFPVNFEVVPFTLDNKTEYFMRFRSDANDFMDSYMVFHTVIHNYVPVLCLCVTNVAIPIKFYQLSKRRRATLNLPSSQLTSQQLKITTTVLTITIMYLFLYIPVVLSLTLGLVDPEYSFGGAKETTMWFLFDIGNVFSYINAANDGITYILMSNHYRTIFKMKYCQCCMRGSKHDNKYKDDSSEVSPQTDGIQVISRKGI